MQASSRLVALAQNIDPSRANALVSELGDAPERALGVLLGTAFPPLTPHSGYQVEAVERWARQGLAAERRRQDSLRDGVLVTAAPEPEAFQRALRRFAWAERARIALRELVPVELGGAPVDVTARELSALADVSLELALWEAQRHVGTRFGEPRLTNGEPSELVAFGMGKLGGLELNAGSDIDLLFVYDTDDGSSQTTLHDHWSRVVQRVVASIETPSEDGFVWRVDLRLRPEGARGPITNSVAATERYYETWGRLWERAALLRARPSAGSARLGALVQRELFAPFVFRHAVDPSIAVALSELVERSRQELSPDPARDLKLGPGGIREAEFFVQSLQLVWGGREPSLRVPGTLPALERLRSRGLVSDREVRRLAQSYLYLRQLEHRVQWMQGVQTHLLPRGQDELARMARTLGHLDERPLLAQLVQARATVAELFASLLPRYRPERKNHRFSALLAALDDPAIAGALSERAFGSAEVAEHLAALARRPDGLLGTVTLDRFPELAARLLDTLAACPDPEQAALALRSFFARFRTLDPYVAALAEDERALARLVTVLGSSRFVADTLIARPELADAVLFGGGAVSNPRAAVELELETQRHEPADPSDVYDAQLAFVTALRLAKRRLTLEVAVADLAGSMGTREATRLLSDLADESVARATQHVLGNAARGLSVIALGKLGGRELGYGSDLDVIFVYDPAATPRREEVTTHFTRAAQRIIRLLSEPSAAGPGYELDVRLRPSGSQGMLVTSIGAFARYHGISLPELADSTSSWTSSGAAWERQALLRARFCAGDAELGRRVTAICRAAAYEGGAPPVEELHHLRRRMERELGRERAGHWDVKAGRGGLLDIEYCVQWLQMRYGADERLRTTDTREALEALHGAGYLDRAHFDVLRDGYGFLRRLEQRLHVLTGSGSSVVDARARNLLQLARRMGFRDEPERPASAQLLARYETVTTGVRSAYCSALGVDGE